MVEELKFFNNNDKYSFEEQIKIKIDDISLLTFMNLISRFDGDFFYLQTVLQSDKLKENVFLAGLKIAIKMHKNDVLDFLLKNTILNISKDSYLQIYEFATNVNNEIASEMLLQKIKEIDAQNKLSIINETEKSEDNDVNDVNDVNINKIIGEENNDEQSDKMVVSSEMFHEFFDASKSLVENGRIEALGIIRDILREYKLTKYQRIKVFKEVYATLLQKLFVNLLFPISQENKLLMMYLITFIFIMNWYDFKLFCIKYMFIHNSYPVISNFYENKSLAIYKLTNNDTALRLFDTYDIILDISNFDNVLYSINRKSLTFCKIPKTINLEKDENAVLMYELAPSERYNYNNFNFNLFNDRIVYDENIGSVENYGVDLEISKYTINDCHLQFLQKHIRFNEYIKYFTNIGDRCIHNLMRNRSWLNSIVYCKQSNEQLLEIIKILNKGIFRFHSECLISSTTDVILYRGINLTNVNYKKGEVIDNLQNQFHSFTRNIKVAYSFGKIILQLKLKKSDVLFPIESMSVYEHETEWITPLNTIFRIVEDPFISVNNNGSNYLIIPIEIIHQSL